MMAVALWLLQCCVFLLLLVLYFRRGEVGNNIRKECISLLAAPQSKESQKWELGCLHLCGMCQTVLVYMGVSSLQVSCM